MPDRDFHEDNIFRNLLRGDDDQVRILDEQRYLDEASQTSPFDRVIPGPGADQTIPETEPEGDISTPDNELPEPNADSPVIPLEKPAVQPPPQSMEPARILTDPNATGDKTISEIQ